MGEHRRFVELKLLGHWHMHAYFGFRIYKWNRLLEQVGSKLFKSISIEKFCTIHTNL